MVWLYKIGTWPSIKGLTFVTSFELFFAIHLISELVGVDDVDTVVVVVPVDVTV